MYNKLNPVGAPIKYITLTAWGSSLVVMSESDIWRKSKDIHNGRRPIRGIQMKQNEPTKTRVMISHWKPFGLHCLYRHIWAL